MKKKLGRHILVDAWECPVKGLNDPRKVEDVVMEAIRAGQATLIHISTHQFSPYGVTTTATLAESHIALHTWPEHGYFAADIFFCGELDPTRSILPLVEGLGARAHRVREIERGLDVVRENQMEVTQELS